MIDSATQTPAQQAPAKMPYSLSRRLLWLLVLATLLVWTLSSISIYLTVKDETQEIFDQALVETAHALLVISEDHHTPIEPALAQSQANTAESTERIVFQIWRRDGQLIYHSTHFSTQPMLPIQPQQPAFDWIMLQGERFRSYQVWDAAQNIQVQIAERDDIRQQIFDESADHLLTIGLIFLPLLAGLIFVLIRISLQPLQQLTDSISTQSIARLQGITPQQTPLEIKPIVDALNQLLSQIASSLDRERRFTANAAHELRTPLAAIRLHAQVLQGARNPAEAAEAALDIQHGVDRCTRLMEQLLVLARLEPQQQQPEKQHFDLAISITQIAAQHAYTLEKQQIRLWLDTPETLLQGHSEQLDILLRNLLDNAIRYSGEGKDIWISCGLHRDGQAYLVVEDQGVGIPASQRAHIFDRFYRLADAASTGSGLGLSIVQQIAEQHQAKIQIEQGRDARGLRVTVTF